MKDHREKHNFQEERVISHEKQQQALTQFPSKIKNIISESHCSKRRLNKDAKSFSTKLTAKS